MNKILSEINTRQLTGVTKHYDWSTLLSFIGFDNLAKLHNNQCIEETESNLDFNRWVIENNHSMIEQGEMPRNNIIPKNWYNAKSTSIETTNRRQYTDKILSEWIDWESGTKLLLEDSYKALMDMSEVLVAERVMQCLKEVSHELVEAEKIYTYLASVNFSIDLIYELDKSVIDV